jgi:hypothetical protein
LALAVQYTDGLVVESPRVRHTCAVRAIVSLTAIAALSGPNVAAASDGESALSIAIGAGTWALDLDDDDDALGPTAGGVALVAYERGFSEALSWRVDLSGGIYGRDGTSWTGVAAAGVVYRLDIIEYVPYALLEVGGAAIGGGPLPGDDSPELDPVFLIGAGLDVLRGRSSSWGIEARAAWVAGTTLVSLGGRYTWRWGFF